MKSRREKMLEQERSFVCRDYPRTKRTSFSGNNIHKYDRMPEIALRPLLEVYPLVVISYIREDLFQMKLMNSLKYRLLSHIKRTFKGAIRMRKNWKRVLVFCECLFSPLTGYFRKSQVTFFTSFLRTIFIYSFFFNKQKCDNVE